MWIASYVASIESSYTFMYLCSYISTYVRCFSFLSYVTQHEKTGLMHTNYTYSCYSKYFPYCIIFSKSVTCMRFLINSCINGKNCVRFLCLHKKLFNFEIQKCGQILCAHKTHFLMPGHIYVRECDSLIILLVYVI